MNLELSWVEYASALSPSNENCLISVIEKFGDRVPQPLSRFDYPIFASCDEGAYRTGIKPLNWPNND